IERALQERNREQNGLTPDASLAMIANLVDKEAITISANHVFMILALVFVFASLLIWMSPKPKGAVGGHAPH
ncbi:MAG TPA: MFS transporter, partial [Acinetobacter sp.]|nr:MFS transporter [Acinetobacter sp.]